MYVSGFDKRGHFGPDLNFEILICTEIIAEQLSFAGIVSEVTVDPH